MRAVLTNFGTTGDVYPFVALAAELTRHGHDAVLALAAAEKAVCQAMVLNPNIYNSVAPVRSVGETLAAALPDVFRDLREVCRNADVLISGHLAVLWRPPANQIRPDGLLRQSRNERNSMLEQLTNRQGGGYGRPAISLGPEAST